MEIPHNRIGPEIVSPQRADELRDSKMPHFYWQIKRKWTISGCRSVCLRGRSLLVLITFHLGYYFMEILRFSVMIITLEQMGELKLFITVCFLFICWIDGTINLFLRFLSLSSLGSWLLMKLIKLYRWMVCHRKEKNNATVRLGKESNISGINEITASASLGGGGGGAVSSLFFL